MTGRFSIPDPSARVGEELMRRAYDLRIRLTKSGDDLVGSFSLEGTMTLPGKADEGAPQTLDQKFLCDLIERFQRSNG